MTFSKVKMENGMGEIGNSNVPEKEQALFTPKDAIIKVSKEAKVWGVKCSFCQNGEPINHAPW